MRKSLKAGQINQDEMIGHTARLERRLHTQKVLVERRQRKGYIGGLYVSRRIILK